MSKVSEKNANNSFLLLLSLFAVFMFSLYFLNKGGIFNTGSKAGFQKDYPKVTLPPTLDSTKKDDVIRVKPKTTPLGKYQVPPAQR